MSKGAIRTKEGLSARDLAGLDAIDLALIEGVEADLPFQMLLRSAACSEEEAYGRIVRLLSLGLLEESAARSMFAEVPSAVRPASAGAGVQSREPARELNAGAMTGVRARPAREVLDGARRTSRASEPPPATKHRAAIAGATRNHVAVRELTASGPRDARMLDRQPKAEKPESPAREVAAAPQVQKPSTRSELAITMVDTSLQSLAQGHIEVDIRTEPAQRGAKASTRRELSATMVDDSSSELAQEHIARRSLPPARRAPEPGEKPAARRPVRTPDTSEGRLDRSRTLEWSPQRVAAELEDWPVPSSSMSERPKAPARMGLGSEPPEESGPVHKYPTGTVVGIGPSTPGFPAAKSGSNTFESDERQRGAGSRLRTSRNSKITETGPRRSRRPPR